MTADLAARIEQWKQIEPKNGVRHHDPVPAGFQSPPKWIEAAREG